MPSTTSALARELWRLAEPYHQLAYRSAEAQTTLTGLGLDRPDLQYFASRLAALGPIDAPVAVAVLYGFAPGYVGGAIPEVWTRASPVVISRARLAIADASLRRALGDLVDDPSLAAVAELARGAAVAVDLPGRPVAAAHLGLGWPDEPHLVLWQACTVLREHRGDAHWSATSAAELDGCECHVLHGADGHMPLDLLQRVTGWSDEAWADAGDRLSSRGLLDAAGVITDGGRAHKLDVEHLTDRLAMVPLRAIGPSGQAALVEGLREPVRRIIAAGMVPTWEVREQLWRDLPDDDRP